MSMTHKLMKAFLGFLLGIVALPLFAVITPFALAVTMYKEDESQLQ